MAGMSAVNITEFAAGEDRGRVCETRPQTHLYGSKPYGQALLRTARFRRADAAKRGEAWTGADQFPDGKIAPIEEAAVSLLARRNSHSAKNRSLIFTS